MEKVDEFCSMESLKPMRLSRRSVMRNCALFAGTKHPNCASEFVLVFLQQQKYMHFFNSSENQELSNILYLCHHLENGNHFDVHGFAAHIRAGDNEKVIIGGCYLEIDADGYDNQDDLYDIIKVFHSSSESNGSLAAYDIVRNGYGLMDVLIEQRMNCVHNTHFVAEYRAYVSVAGTDL